MKRSWLDYVSPHQRDIARHDLRYRELLELTAAGQIAKLQAALADFGDALLAALRPSRRRR